MSVSFSIQASTTSTCSQSHSLDSEELTPLQGIILNPKKAQRMVEFFSLLGDYNRLRIVSLLAKRELCVCDLAAVLKMSESAVSHQLRILRAMRLVKNHKIGRKVFYNLCDHHVLDLYRSVAEHLDEPNEDE
jgi:ArsR family transcriptional regulator, lead/cadmium/zinc/bismuth-responsive transcriptional repressor